MKPRIGIIPVDPGGIGPELIAKLLADSEVHEKADILLIGDRHLFEMGQTQAGTETEMVACTPIRVTGRISAASPFMSARP